MEEAAAASAAAVVVQAHECSGTEAVQPFWEAALPFWEPTPAFWEARSFSRTRAEALSHRTPPVQYLREKKKGIFVFKDEKGTDSRNSTSNLENENKANELKTKSGKRPT